MKKNFLGPICFVALGVSACAAGIFIGEIDDAPGASALGIALLLGSVAAAGWTMRRSA